MEGFGREQRTELMDAFHRGCSRLGYSLPLNVSEYGINTIERFIRDDKKVHEPPIFSYFNQENEEAMSLRDIADASLITSGFFPPSDEPLKRYIEGIDRSAYGDLAHRGFVINVIFKEMERVFGPVADALGYVRIDGPLESGDIKAMHEKLKQERDPKLREILKKAIFSKAPVIV